jgi:hypothetical protein
MRFIQTAALAALALLVTLPVAAQTSQYTAPGGALGGEPLTKAQIEAQMEAARWRLGPIRLAPWLALRGLTYESNVFVSGNETTSDVTGSAGAGLTAYLPTGSNVFWVVQAMPEYLWWLDLSDRNQLIGRYGAGVFADLNRLRIALDGRDVERQAPATSESAQQVIGEETTAHLNVSLDLSTSLSLRADLSSSDLAYRSPDDAPTVGGFRFSDLDRKEQVLRGELVYRRGDKAEVGLGVELTDTEFEAGARNRSSTGTSPSLHLRLNGNRLGLDAQILRRELEPEPGSELRPVRQAEGDFRLTLTPGTRFTFGVYGNRTTAYALADEYSQLTVERLGFEVGSPLGRRLDLRAFFEAGTDDYEGFGGAPRSDDVTAYGLVANFKIGEWLSYQAGFRQVEYDSNLDAFDRDYFRVTSSLTLSTGEWVWR